MRVRVVRGPTSLRTWLTAGWGAAGRGPRGATGPRTWVLGVSRTRRTFVCAEARGSTCSRTDISGTLDVPLDSLSLPLPEVLSVVLPLPPRESFSVVLPPPPRLRPSCSPAFPHPVRGRRGLVIRAGARRHTGPLVGVARVGDRRVYGDRDAVERRRRRRGHRAA